MCHSRWEQSCSFNRSEKHICVFVYVLIYFIYIYIFFKNPLFIMGSRGQRELSGSIPFSFPRLGISTPKVNLGFLTCYLRSKWNNFKLSCLFRIFPKVLKTLKILNEISDKISTQASETKHNNSISEPQYRFCLLSWY